MNSEPRPLRVVIFSRFPETAERPRGGVESATVGLVRGLLERGDVEVHVVTLERAVNRVRVDSHDGVMVHRLPRSRWPMILDVFVGPGRALVDSYIRELAPDVVHFQETYGFGARRGDVPVLFTVHGFDSLNLKTEQARAWRIRAPLWRVAERLGIGSHAHLVSIARYVTNELRALSSVEVFEIPNAIDPRFFAVKRSSVPGRVLFAGWLNPRKNLLAALQALRELTRRGTEAELRVAGARTHALYAERIERYIEEHRLQDRVRLLDSISHDQMRREMSEACALLLPSLQENAPMVIAEALASGLPVVASDVCGIPDMVDEGTTGYLINPTDPLMIADRLEQLLVDDDLRSRMCTAARALAERTWHPSAVAGATVALYRRLIERHAQGGRGSVDSSGVGSHRA
jgi:glycosyltransferase involved in cell wall biosynthesis